MISDFLDDQIPGLRFSKAESRRFGFGVGRLSIPIHPNCSDEKALEIIGESSYPLVIVRVDTSRAQLLEKLQSLDAYESLVADTLVYFKWGAQVGIGLVDGESGFAIADTATQDEVIDLIADSFGAYRNHYGANPRLGQGATLNGYKEWASSLMATSGSVTLVARDRSTSRALGFVLMVVDRSRRLAEIMLNGVHPMVRRRGVYSALLNAAKSHLESVDSSWPLYISTQSDNYSVIGAWTKLGLAPDVSLATIHLMHRDYFVS